MGIGTDPWAKLEPLKKLSYGDSVETPKPVPVLKPASKPVAPSWESLAPKPKAMPEDPLLVKAVSGLAGGVMKGVFGTVSGLYDVGSGIVHFVKNQATMKPEERAAYWHDVGQTIHTLKEADKLAIAKQIGAEEWKKLLKSYQENPYEAAGGAAWTIFSTIAPLWMAKVGKANQLREVGEFAEDVFGTQKLKALPAWAEGAEARAHTAQTVERAVAEAKPGVSSYRIAGTSRLDPVTGKPVGTQRAFGTVAPGARKAVKAAAQAADDVAAAAQAAGKAVKVTGKVARGKPVQTAEGPGTVQEVQARIRARGAARVARVKLAKGGQVTLGEHEVTPIADVKAGPISPAQKAKAMAGMPVVRAGGPFVQTTMVRAEGPIRTGETVFDNVMVTEHGVVPDLGKGVKLVDHKVGMKSVEGASVGAGGASEVARAVEASGVPELPAVPRGHLVNALKALDGLTSGHWAPEAMTGGPRPVVDLARRMDAETMLSKEMGHRLQVSLKGLPEKGLQGAIAAVEAAAKVSGVDMKYLEFAESAAGKAIRDPAERLAAYYQAVNRTVARRRFVAAIGDLVDPKTGEKMVVVGKRPEGYQLLSGAFRVHEYAHPAVARDLQRILESMARSEIVDRNVFRRINSTIKRVVMYNPGIHVKTLEVRAGTATGWLTRDNPIMGTVRAAKLYRSGDQEIVDAIRDGVRWGLPGELGPSVWSKIPVMNRVEEWADNFLWGTVARNLKVHLHGVMKAKLIRKYGLDPARAGQMAAEQANRMMGDVPDWMMPVFWQKYGSYIWFARNYVYSQVSQTSLALGRVFPGELGMSLSPKELKALVSMNREMFARSVVQKLVMSNAAQYALNGTFTFDNPAGHKTDIWVGDNDAGVPFYIRFKEWSDDPARLALALGSAMADVGGQLATTGHVNLKKVDFSPIRAEFWAKSSIPVKLGMDLAGARKLTGDVLFKSAVAEGPQVPGFNLGVDLGLIPRSRKPPSGAWPLQALGFYVFPGKRRGMHWPVPGPGGGKPVPAGSAPDPWSQLSPKATTARP